MAHGKGEESRPGAWPAGLGWHCQGLWGYTWRCHTPLGFQLPELLPEKPVPPGGRAGVGKPPGFRPSVNQEDGTDLSCPIVPQALDSGGALFTRFLFSCVILCPLTF